jgi:hypothetical protein
MTQSFQPQPRGGLAGMALLFCAVAGGVGLAFDFALNGGGGHTLVAAPGGRALIGAGAALVLVLGAHVLRRLLGRPPGSGEGRGDAEHSA